MEMAARHLRNALALFLSEGEVEAPVRGEIGASWDRSVRSGLRPDRFEAKFDSDFNPGAAVIHAARPVLDEVAADLSGSGVGVVLTDERGHVVDRWVADRGLMARFDKIFLAPGFVYEERSIGTNAIGTALAQRGPSLVDGTEHFADALISMACAAVPISDPATGRLLGVVDLTCRARDASPLLLPLARRAGREIERRLLDHSGVTERILLQRFLRERRGAKGPLAIVNEQRVIANAAAERLIDPQDGPMLWEHATRLLATRSTAPSEVTLNRGPVSMRCEPVFDGGDLLGVLVYLKSMAGPPGAVSGRRERSAAFRSSHLTETERSVALLAVEGSTNREISERLFMSPYTVDSHLRSIFQKMGVRSRVQLARLALTEDALA
jgi:sigma-54 dependent transcriptional regulator, acetoin dehydrogenase operon transcriptional activator AcoR